DRSLPLRRSCMAATPPDHSSNADSLSRGTSTSTSLTVCGSYTTGSLFQRRFLVQRHFDINQYD
ncbi:hypothetical protein P7K49_000947, partial [Saguinus oedipus]